MGKKRKYDREKRSIKRKREARKVLTRYIKPLSLNMFASSSPNNYFNTIVEHNYIEQAVEEEFFTALRQPTFDLATRMMRRKTIKMVLRDAKELIKQNNVFKLPSNVPLETAIALPIWYLSSDKNDLEFALQVFNLNSIKKVEAVLEYGLLVISNLKRQSRMVWPTVDEQRRTSEFIERRYKFENVVGALTTRVFTVKTSQTILLQALINEKLMYIFADFSYCCHMKTAFFTAPSLINFIDNLPDKFYVMGDGVYNECTYFKNIDKIITPIEETELGEYDKRLIQMFNGLQDAAMAIAKVCLNETVKRFPRLLVLPRRMENAIISACVLHNYCKLYHDETPLYA